MSALLKGLTIEEVDKVIRNSKSIKEAAIEIGVKPQDLYLFRSQNMKAFKKLKADLEQGLIIEEVPVMKTKPVKTKKKTAPQIDIKVDKDTGQALKALEKDYQILQKQRDDLELKEAALKDEVESWRKESVKYQSDLQTSNETIESQAEQIKVLNIQAVEDQETIKDLQARVKEVEDKSLKMYDMQEKKHKTQLQHQQEKIDGQLKGLQAAAIDVTNYRKKIEALEQESMDNEQKTADMVADYERRLKGLQTEIDELNSKTSAASLNVQNDALTDDSQYVMRDAEHAAKESVAFNIINKPAHYNYGEIEVIDFIDQLAEHYGSQSYHAGNVIKYIARAPHKEDTAQDLKKAEYYLKRLIAKIEKGRVE